MVLLIARALDLQAAARLEPQLTRIAEELEGLHRPGRIEAHVPADRAEATVSEGLVVYYFHGNTRCPTCRSIESQAHEVVQSDFAAELKSGAVSWKMLNYEDSATADLAKKFEIQIARRRSRQDAARRRSPGGSGWIASGRWLETSPRTLPTCGTRSAR